VSTGQTPYSGPPLNVEGWIERGSSGDWSTSKGATSDVAHFEINHDPYVEEQWVKEYAVGRKNFRDPNIENARQFAASDKPAEAIISSRLALEIPWQGSGFMYNQGAVVRAMGMEGPLNSPPKRATSNNDVMEALQGSLRTMHLAMQKAFDTPYETKIELESIAKRGREAIKGREVQTWIEAVNFFGEKGELLPAGIGALELGAAYEQQELPDEALDAYKAASELLKHHLEVVTRRENPTRHTAEVNELKNHLVAALSSVVRLYASNGSVKGEAKEAVKAAVYELDDLGAPATIVQKGYEFLASSARFKQKRFYKKEAAGIAGEIAVANFFANGGGVLFGGPEPRRDRRHLRPPIVSN
jgi:hypothetical protein